MATSKTGSFWVTESVQMAVQGTAVQGSLDLSSYIDVGDQQGVSIEEINYVVQVYDTVLDSYVNSFTGSVTAGDNFQVDFQVTDLNPGTALVSADDNSLVSSGVVLYNEPTNTQSVGTDFFPDSYGKLDESRITVSPTLYLVSVPVGALTLVANHVIQTTVIAKLRIIKLSNRDWMSIAITGVAASN